MLLGTPRKPDVPPLLVGHRGACEVAPENTLPSFQRALDDGADIVELDVRLSADGKVVVMHDVNVDRTTDSTGLVAEMDLRTLKRLDAGSWFAPEYAGTRIPTLAEVCDWAKGRMGLLLEFKYNPFGSFDPALAIAAAKVVQEQGLIEQVAAISYQPKAMQQMTALLPGIRAGVMTSSTRVQRIIAWLAKHVPAVNRMALAQKSLLYPLTTAQSLDVTMVSPNINLVSPLLVKTAHEAGFPVSSGGLHWNYPRAIAMGVDTISGNNPGRVKQRFLT